MKIAWISPFAESSAIGAYSDMVCDALVERDVDVVRVRCDVLEKLNGTFFPYDLPFDKFLESPPDDIDHIIYNVGNEFSNHGALVQDGLPPGIFILHDIAFPHLYAAYCEYHGRSYADTLKQLAQLKIVPANHEDILRRLSETDEPDRKLEILAELDFAFWVTRNATRLIVHSPKSASLMRVKTGLQVDDLPLAYWRPEDTDKVHDIPPKESSKLVLSTFGHVVGNKRIASLIKAIGGDAAIARKWQLRIVGPILEEDKTGYKRLIANQPNEVDVTFLGLVDDEEFQRQMRVADCISCLRYPSYESGSATLALAMATNGNVLVTEESFSGSVAKGLATFIRIKSEENDIRAALRNMQSGKTATPEELHRIRVKARDMFDVGNYADWMKAYLVREFDVETGMEKALGYFPEGEQFSLALRRWCAAPLLRAAKYAEKIVESREKSK